METESSFELGDRSDLRGFVALVRRQIVPIAVCAILTALATLAFSLTRPDSYEATARVLYTDPGVTAGAIGGGDPARAVDTFVRLATTDDVLSPVARSMSFDSTDEVRVAVTVTASSNANLLDVRATAPTASEAAQLANRVARSLIRWRDQNRNQQLEARIGFLRQQLQALAGKSSPSEVAAASDLRTQLAEASAQKAVPSPELVLVSPATLPSAPYSPKPFRNAIFGLLAGLILGFGVGSLRDRLDRRLRDIDEVENVYPWPSLGAVPLVANEEDAHALVDFSGISRLADAYRNIRTNLTLLGLDDPSRKVWAISSAMPGEGKSAAAANLTGAFASSGLKVLAISADLHAPSLHGYFDEADGNGGTTARRGPDAGLIEVLANEVSPQRAAHRIPLPRSTVRFGGGVDVIANARVFSDPAILFQSKAMESLLAWAREQYDAIVIDAPPLLYTAEASLLGRLADGLIIVARINHLTRREAVRATRVLETMHLRPVGVITTGLRESESEFGYRQRVPTSAEMQEPERPRTVSHRA